MKVTITREEFDDWKNGFVGTQIIKFLEDRRKAITESVTAPLLHGGVISDKAQLVHHGRMTMLDELVNLEYETLESENEERVDTEVPDSSYLGESGRQAS